MLRAFAPGRTELAGNHTDHEGGRVVAATIAEGITLLASPNGSDAVRVESAGFAPFSVRLDDLGPRDSERGNPAALVRGMAAGFARAGFVLPGFDAQVESALPVGGGLSSSAAFELAFGAAMTLLASGNAQLRWPEYTAMAPRAGQDAQPQPAHGASKSRRPGGALPDALSLACMAQDAERDWFGKPCGLMDQLVIACGGIVEIDFADAAKPLLGPIDFDFNAAGYAVCLVDVGCDHSRYTEEYARVPADMQAVARLCGGTVLGQVDEAEFLEHLAEARSVLGDRAALRGLHFYREMHLTDVRARALRQGDIGAFLRATERSGASSAQYLQNVSCAIDDQPAMVALALADHLLAGRGACRIHGGGFGGSIQAFVPVDLAPAFVQGMETYLKKGCCRMLTIGKRGTEASWM